MITITHKDNRIAIKGHANYAPYGQDIVCAAVSTLVQTFVASAHTLTPGALKVDMSPGNTVIEYKELSAEAHLLVSSFFIGLGMVALDYPDYVRLV
jgi:uncharacterized protein YsxB (DUF464 family)